MTNFKIPKAILISILVLALAQISLAQIPNLKCVKQISGAGGIIGYSITTDNNGNIYTTGIFGGGIADFDPGPGTANLTSSLFNDIFIQKLDSNGNFVWAKKMGGAGDDIGMSVKTDNNSNVYTTGYFESTVDFDPGVGTTNLTSAGGTDIFIQKLDSNGNLIWVKQIGGTSEDRGYSITVDNCGNIYTTGYFMGTVNFDPGVGTTNLTSAGLSDMFIQKLDSSGNLIWVKQMGGNNFAYVYGYSITTDSIGNVYTTGRFRRTADFDPGAGTTNLTSASSNYYDIFIQKLDTSGNLIWAKRMGGNSSDYGYSITTDNIGNVYTTGTFKGTVDFDPNTGTTNLTSAGNHDIFIQKLDSSGILVWVKQMGGTNTDKVSSITTDNIGNIYTTGYFKGIADFDPGVGITNLTSAGLEDIFIQKLDTSGNLVWVKQMGNTIGDDCAYCITTDIKDNIYTTGYFKGTTDFDPGAGTSNLTSVGWGDAFIQKLNQCMPSTASINISACDSFNWAANNTTYTASGVYTVTISNTASCDSIITLNLTVNNSHTIMDTVTACNSYLWPIDSNIYTTSGIYMDSNINSVGCDSTHILNLTINNSNTGLYTITACDSFIWIDGITYTTNNNTATHTLTNSVGCDSVVTLNLTINNSNTGTDLVIACDSLIWIDGITYTASNTTATHTLTNTVGCDSVVSLNLTINNSNSGTDIMTACKTYTWIDGNTYTSSNNTATHTLTNSGGCDSIVTLNLTIDTVDVSLTTTDPSIMANASGASYQWLDCNNNYSVISGATVQSYTATANGDYAVEITQNNCTDTSLCVTISTVGISENPVFKGVSIYPNPTQDIVNINLGDLRNVSIKVFNVQNQLIYHKENINTLIYQFVLKEAPGVYFIELNAAGEKQQYKLIKGL